MALPKQIQRQADQVEQFEQQVAAAAEPKPNEGAETQDAATTETQSSSPTAPVAELAKAPDPEEETWKARFLSLQGMYHSQVPVLQQQVKELLQQLQLQQAQKTVEQPAKSADPLVTKTDVDAFGEDLIEMSRRVARDEFRALASNYETQIVALEGKLAEATKNVGEVAKVQAKTGKERFFETLNTRLPAWDELQNTPECQKWLSSRVPGTLISWNDALVNGAERQDVDSVIEVFEQFKRLQAPAAEATQRSVSSARSELERQVAPSKSSASARTPQGEKRTYTGNDYQTESMKVVRLAQAGKHEDAARLEAELNTALAEGRIRP